MNERMNSKEIKNHETQWDNSIIKIIGLEKAYETKYGSNVIFENLSLSLDESKIHVIFGKSGIGKSTLLKLIAGFEPYQSGTILIDGQPIEDHLSTKQSSNELYNHVLKYIPQEGGFLPELTILENSYVNLMNSDDINIKENVKTILKAFDNFSIKSILNSYPSQISGGEMKRAILCQYMANPPKILLIDEPTSNIDLSNTKIMIDMLKDLKTKYGVTIVITSHDTNLRDHADFIYELENQGILDT